MKSLGSESSVMKYLILAICSACVYINIAVAVFVSDPPVWENQYKVATVNNYDNATLRQHFEELRMPQTNIPGVIHDEILNIINVPTGKSVIADIVSSLEPRLNYVNSLRQIINIINQEINSENAIRIAFGLMNSINPGVVSDKDRLIGYIETGFIDWVDKIDQNPQPIARQDYMENLLVRHNLDNFIGILRGKFQNAINVAEKKLNSYRFQFSIDSDRYMPDLRTISINPDLQSRASVVSGPRLLIGNHVVGMVMRDIAFENDEKLFHEILHYYHIGLRKSLYVYSDNFDTLGEGLIRSNLLEIRHSLLLKDLWTTQEEFRTITGGFWDMYRQQLVFSPQNESCYLRDKGKSFRCSHSGNYITEISMDFIRIGERGGGVVHYFNNEDRDVSYIGYNFI